jgi:DNA-directed RNA polymerase II subunit RPB2
VLKERLFEQSDFYQAPVCRVCGMFAISNDSGSRGANNSSYCKNCGGSSTGSTTNVVHIQIPYACKLLIQELMAMHIYIKLGTSVY